jgi:RNA polymerase sigma-70 factor (ECF subfamily)
MKHDYEAVWRETGPTLWRSVRAYAGGRADVADDAVAEAFARAIARDGEVREPISYLYRIAFRVAAAELRERGDRRDLADHEGRESVPADGHADLWSALTALPPHQRAALSLFYRADLPVREVGRRLGRSSAAVRMDLVRGRRRLANLLEEDDR